jgi:hypothetical protein
MWNYVRRHGLPLVGKEGRKAREKRRQKQGRKEESRKGAKREM